MNTFPASKWAKKKLKLVVEFLFHVRDQLTLKSDSNVIQKKQLDVQMGLVWMLLSIEKIIHPRITRQLINVTIELKDKHPLPPSNFHFIAPSLYTRSITLATSIRDDAYSILFLLFSLQKSIFKNL